MVLKNWCLKCLKYAPDVKERGVIDMKRPPARKEDAARDMNMVYIFVRPCAISFTSLARPSFWFTLK